MNKRDAVLSILDTNRKPDYIPAAFFLHFDPIYHSGQPAVDKHLEYFRYTGMDFVKIQYEHVFPHVPQIQKPDDWANVPFYKLDFFEKPLRVVEGLVKSAKSEAIIILTLYSPFMQAVHTAGSQETLLRHIHENPDKVKKGMQIITDSLMGFVKECVRLGLDGFYTSTQGGENGRLGGGTLFNSCVKPYDLALMNEINRSCIFNILHVCDYHQPYEDLTPFLDYPGHVANIPLELSNRHITTKDVAALFKRPVMGGLDRKGVISNGTPDQIRKAVTTTLQNAPERFILGADCTVPATTSWDNLKLAIEMAHSFHK